MTYGDMYNSFVAETGIDKTKIQDYRPCCEIYDVPNINNAIVLWLSNGSKVIYIMKVDNSLKG